MQNIMAAQSEGGRMRNMYNNAGMLNSNLTFVIPVFENMPRNPAPRPNGNIPVVTRRFDEARVDVSGTLTLRAGPRVDSILLQQINNGARVVVLERAAVRSHDGMYWDRVIAFRGTAGHTGYMARGPANDPNRLWIQTHTLGSDTTIRGQNNNNVVTGPNNDFRVEGNHFIAEPGTTLNDIRNAGHTIISATRNGVDVSNNPNLGTGTIVTTNNGTFTVVKMGDLDGDGRVNAVDLLMLVRTMEGRHQLHGVYNEAARINGQERITAVDLLMMVRHLERRNNISI